MLRHISVLAVIALFGSLLACGGGGAQKVPGSACPRGEYQAIKVNDSKFKKLDPTNLDSFPAGTYTYNKGELLYVDSAEGVKVHVQEQKVRVGRDRKEEWRSKPVCLRGFKSGMKLSASIDVLSSMNKLADGSIEVSYKSFGFVNDNTFEVKIEDESEKLNQSPKDFFSERYGETTSSLYKTGRTSDKRDVYQLRGTFSDDAGVRYTFQAEYLFKAE